jgi:DNA-binding response OmpR family regulator
LVREDATFWRGVKVPLTGTQQRLLYAFSRTGYLSHGQMEDLLCSWASKTGNNLGKVHLYYLRKRLAAVDGPKIVLERGEGYRLEPREATP